MPSSPNPPPREAANSRWIPVALGATVLASLANLGLGLTILRTNTTLMEALEPVPETPSGYMEATWVSGSTTHTVRTYWSEATTPAEAVALHNARVAAAQDVFPPNP